MFAGRGGAGWLGAHVVAGAGHDVAEVSAGRDRSYNADRVIDYTATPLLQAVAGERFDVVLNLARTSPEKSAALADLTADGRAFVITTGPAPAPGRGVRAVQMSARSDAAQPAGLVARVDVAQPRPLADLAAVHDQAAAGQLSGKTLLIP